MKLNSKSELISAETVVGPDEGASQLQRRLIAVAVQAIGVSFFAACTGWSAAVRIPLPFTPVPLTLQTLPVLLSGGIMGSQLGVLSMLVYVFLGIAGFPFFSGMSSGFHVVLGPTGGFIIGFVVASWVVGRVCRGREGTWRSSALALAAGSCVVYIFGVTGLVASSGMPLVDALWKGMIPFLPGDIIKVCAAVAIINGTHRWTRRLFSSEAA